jgi:hypothetical protein
MSQKGSNRPVTFDDFFAEAYQDPPGFDANTQAKMRTIARMALSQCWNAALNTVLDCQLPATAEDFVTRAHGLKV